MQQIKVSLTPALNDFLGRYAFYGFPDKSTMARAALSRLQAEIELRSLQQSADLYTEVYANDPGLQELTEDALTGWPE